MKKIIISLFILGYMLPNFAQTKIYLWYNKKGKPIHRSAYIIAYPAPDSARKDVGIIVSPGGSYAHLMGIKTEGFGVAEWLNANGISAFVLHYRVGWGHHHPQEIQDWQKTAMYIRNNAEKYKINKNKIGAMGFSAGGHLSLLAAMFKDTCLVDTICPTSVNPNFVVPVYPVVSMQDSLAHKRSRRNLLGLPLTQERKNDFSIELQVTEDFPPVFLVANKDDHKVKYQNSENLSRTLAHKTKNHRFLLYNEGGHGYGGKDRPQYECTQWKNQFILWLNELKLID